MEKYIGEYKDSTYGTIQIFKDTRNFDNKEADAENEKVMPNE